MCIGPSVVKRGFVMIPDVATVIRKMFLMPELWERLTDEQIVAVMALTSSFINPDIVCDEIRKGLLEFNGLKDV